MSEALGLSQRAIRYYEAEGLIRCGRDRRNSRTLDPVSVAALTIIAELKAIGLAFSDITPLITDQGDAQVDIRVLLQSHIQNLERQRAAAIAYMTSLPSV